jgi:hypothetical protein
MSIDDLPLIILSAIVAVPIGISLLATIYCAVFNRQHRIIGDYRCCSATYFNKTYIKVQKRWRFGWVTVYRTAPTYDDRTDDLAYEGAIREMQRKHGLAGEAQ